MNERFQRGRFTTPAIGAAAVVAAALVLATLGRPSLAEEKPKPTATALAKERGLREKPLAAGRDKEALAAEAAAARQKADSAWAVEVSKIDCGGCHVCDDPTKENPCLRMCPRSVAEVIAEAAHERLPDDVVLLGAFEWQERRFMPVRFTHKLHADMAGTAGGCQVCHHHTTGGQMHPSCSTCHKPVFVKSPGEEMRMPNLKGAYHRQCMGCHREWCHNTKCLICHLPREADDTEPIAVEKVLPRTDVALHPPIENPEHIRHKTDHEAGPYVVFRHKEHIELYGYKCENCHKGQTCSRCHEQAEEARPPRTETTRRERHSACFPCHEDCACERCHSQQERPEPKRLDHAAAGFSLGKYHERLTCRACHKRLFFIRKLEGDCGFCHEDWEPDTFDHAVTGQVLDENHAEIDCAECHLEGQFDRPPSCEECHDPEDGVAFPAKRPGPVVKPAGPKAQEKD